MARKRRNRKLKNAYLVIVEGETETAYFRKLQEVKRSETIHIKPKIPKHTSLEEMFKLAKKESKNYSKVFIIIELDKVLLNNELQKLQEHIRRINKDNIKIILLNPCIELWFLLHFIFTESKSSQCKNVVKRLKKHINNYQKGSNIGKFGLLFEEDKVQNAITNAKKLGTLDIMQIKDPSEITPLAEIYILLEEFI